MTSNIDIVNVGNKTKALHEYDNKDFGTLDEYLEIARRTIVSYAGEIRLGLADEMLKNEDAVANVAHAVMMADWHFDGRGDKFGFRKQRIKWAIRNYITRKTHRQYTTTIDGGGHCAMSLKDTEANMPDVNINREEMATSLHKLLDSGSISKQAASYLRQYYLEGSCLQQIADRRGVTKQGVQQLITSSLRVLKETITNDHYFRGIIDYNE